MMPGDPAEILPNDPPPSPRRAARVTCDFCQCELAPSGDVLKMSDRARSMRDGDDEIKKRDKRVTELETEIAEHKRKIAELEGTRQPSGLTLY